MQATDNSTYLRELLVTMFVQSFPNLTPPATKLAVNGLFDNCRDQNAFKQHLRDFLVQLKEFGGGEDLFTEEREAEQARKVRRGSEGKAWSPSACPTDPPNVTLRTHLPRRRAGC